MKQLFSLCFLVLTSCGYHFQDPDSFYDKEGAVTISVPYIKGDVEGNLNQALALEIAQTNCFDYRKENGTLILSVSILSDDADLIGYRYDRDPNTGTLRPNILGTENRRNIKVSCELKDSNTGEVVAGPLKIFASGDYDYVENSSIYDLTFSLPGGKPQTVIDFSLGQLDAIDGASDDVRRPIYHALSEKIVSALLNSYRK